MTDERTIRAIREGKYRVVFGGFLWNGDLIVTGRKYQKAAQELSQIINLVGTLEQHAKWQQYIREKYEVEIEEAEQYRKYL